MNKALENMNGTELGKLFPVILCEYDPQWPALFEMEKAAILKAAGAENILSMHHIGSTAVPGLLAKPTIDILLLLQNDAALSALTAALQRIGYIYIPQPKNPPPQSMFAKGYTPAGFSGQCFHVHTRYNGDHDELYFRDYLILHSETAAAYAKLKLQLKEAYPFDRDGYTDAKESFVKETVAKARKEQKDTTK